MYLLCTRIEDGQYHDAHPGTYDRYVTDLVSAVIRWRVLAFKTLLILKTANYF